jgi:hypothetical protein
MKYIALIYTDEKSAPQRGSAEFGPFMAGYFAATERFRRDGVYVAGDALQPVAMATSVRLRQGKVETMDGPFAETKEQLGGYYILDCKDLDAAIAYAAMIPGAAQGTVEVRPLIVYS